MKFWSTLSNCGYAPDGLFFYKYDLNMVYAPNGGILMESIKIRTKNTLI